ncbi:MAG TPA: cytochrome c peroxidase, partial [Candidatus Sulfotelmatobacter sp.]|nr:cytochrome c peroxidase [Candidatus Sulfotelmatobacter sp.]
MRGAVISLLALIAALLLAPSAAAPDDARLSPKEQLGKLLFFDASLSVPAGQSCATCHAPDAGFAGPDKEINGAGAVYGGAEKGRFGNRKPPTSSYG